MKKRFLLFAFVAISAVSFAQVAPSFGIKGGASISGMRGDAVNNLQDVLDFTNGMVSTGDRTGFFAGAYANFPLSENFSVEPGVYYSQKGYEMKGELNIKGLEFIGANAKATLQSQYVDIPVLLKGNFGGFELFAGPQVSLLLNSDLRTTAGVFGFNLLDRKMDASEQFNKFDAGVTGGIGYQFGNGLNISASYDYGLTKVDANRNVDSYNRAFKVGIGYRF